MVIRIKAMGLQMIWWWLVAVKNITWWFYLMKIYHNSIVKS